jgi:hypothetical protein
MHAHDGPFVDPGVLAWTWLSTEIKNSWASCCAYPAMSMLFSHVVLRIETGPRAPLLLDTVPVDMLLCCEVPGELFMDEFGE